jgi:hypothetical protein
MKEKNPKEKAIVAVGLGGLYVFLAFEGETLECEVENVSSSPVDVIGDGAFPSKVGIYYWEAVPEWRSYMTLDGMDEPELEWTEEVIRPATKEDLVVFGLAYIVINLLEEKEGK